MRMKIRQLVNVRALFLPALVLNCGYICSAVTPANCVFPAGAHPSASQPVAVAVDPVRSRIYAVHRGIYRDLGVNNGLLPTDMVSVVDQRTGNILTTIQVGKAVNGLTQGIAVDSGRNRVYVGNADDRTVSVIDSATNTVVATTSVVGEPAGIAADPARGLVYVATGFGGNSLLLLDSTSGAVVGNVTLGGQGGSVAVDSRTHLVYVQVNAAPTAIVAVNPDTRSIQGQVQLSLLYTIAGIAVDPASRVYAVDYNTGVIAVIDITGSAPSEINRIFTSVSYAESLAVDPVTHLLYTTFSGDNKVRILSGDGVILKTLDALRLPTSIAIDSATGAAYVTDTASDSLTVVDLSRQVVSTTIPLGTSDFGLAFDPATNRLYVTNAPADAVSVVDAGSRTVIGNWLPGPGPFEAGVDTGLQQLYVTNTGDNTLSILSTATGQLKGKVSLGRSTTNASRIAVNLRTHRVYATGGDASNTVTVLDGSTNQIVATIPVGSRPQGIALDDTAGKVYVPNLGDGTISVIDSAANQVMATFQSPLPKLIDVAVDPGLRRLYVVIHPSFIGDFSGLEVLDADTGRFISQLALGSSADSIVVNPSTHQIFVSDDVDGTVTIVDGNSAGVVATVAAGSGAVRLALDAGSGVVYVANPYDGTVACVGPLQLPGINAGGVVNGGSFSQQPPAPASIGSLFGVNLASSTVASTTLLLPTLLGGVSVQINGISVPLFFVSSTQINFQFPWELLGQSQVSITVTVNGLTSMPQTVTLSPLAPVIFATNSQGTGQGAIQIANTTIFAAPQDSIPGAQARPARRGEFVTIYCTGLGDVTNRPATGAAASSNPLSATIATPTVTIGGMAAPVSFSGLAPGFVGLYQVNVQVPENAPTGDTIPVILATDGVSLNIVTIAVQ